MCIIKSDEGMGRTKGRVRSNSTLFLLLAYMCWDISLLLSFDWNMHHWFSWVSSLWTGTRITPPSLLGLQLIDDWSWDFSASIIMLIMYTNSSYVHIYLSTYLFLFPQKAKIVLGEYSVSINYLKEIGSLVHATNRQSFNRNSTVLLDWKTEDYFKHL